MNEYDKISAALQKRAGERSLADGFSENVMSAIYASQTSRKRRNNWYAVAGYVVAMAVCLATLIYCAGDIFMHAARNMYTEMSHADGDSLQLIIIVVPVASLLLLGDLLLRRRSNTKTD